MLKLNLRLEDTVSQTYDGAANFSGHIKGCAKLFQATVEHAQYFHCSNHDLNLALCHTCNDVPEIRNMLSSMTELKLFFKYSPKRTMLLESMIDEENKKSNRKKKIPVQKVKVFCETRWIQRHVVLEEVQLLYEPILQTLDTITSEKGWDHKTVDLANGLLKNITESTFLAALNVCSYTLGFTKQLSSMLQGTAMDVIEAYKQIELVKTQLNSLRGNCDEVFISDIWPKVKELAHIADIELSTPRQCRRQTK